jgi:hypothetical protein
MFMGCRLIKFASAALDPFFSAGLGATPADVQAQGAR